MFNQKIINLIVSSNRKPFEITISTCNGQFIGRKNIRSDTARFCLATNACCLKISGKYQNETIFGPAQQDHDRRRGEDRPHRDRHTQYLRPSDALPHGRRFSAAYHQETPPEIHHL